ncbi:hypothetical protein CHS0354_022142 [Potamilus streckersoni]|uniref:Uncharacterized protein n=1 Tax=Potamilus streckersoni TaxID=2493646 RepID=A0AAE0VJH5_9BIVA|nr:hypothetical protein CHS0354_022142 [Potamilus streckersoni]
MAALTTSGAMAVASLPKNEGRQKLAVLLGWKPFDEEKELQQDIHLDYLYEVLTFAAEKGFPWGQVAHVVKLAESLLQNIKAGTLTESIEFYKDKSSELADTLGERNYKIFTDFIFNIILPHFKLYKYALTKDRTFNCPNIIMEVRPMDPPAPLKEAKALKVWEYERQVQQIEKKVAERTKERLNKKSEIVEQSDKKINQSLKNVDSMAGKPVTKEVLQEIMNDVIGSYSEAFRERIQADIAEVQEDLEFKLEMTSLPRPQVLGPPPRYSLKQKSPVTQQKPDKDQKSPKESQSRGSSRSSKKK